MRKIAALTFISLDGVMQAPGGPEEDPSGGFTYGGWTVPFSDDFTSSIMSKQMGMPFDLLLGRKTYEIFAAYWPHQQNTDGAKALNMAKKYVVSSKNIDLPWEESILITGDVVAKLNTLKKQDGPILQVYGSSQLMQTLLKNDLVDELWLKIFPITLGTGKRLFAEGTIPAAYTLIETETSPGGVIFASYARSGDVKTGSFA